MSRRDEGIEHGPDRPRPADGEPRHDREELLADLRRVDGLTSGTPSEREYAEHGEFGVTTFRRRFGSWNAAKREAGLETERNERTTAAMADDVARVADEVDGPYVTPESYAERGNYPVAALPAEESFWIDLRDRVGLAVTPLRHRVAGPE